MIRHLGALPLRPGGGMWPSRPATAAAWSSLDTPDRLAHYRADLGVTVTSGRARIWDDQSGYGNHIDFPGVSGTRPTPDTWAAANDVDVLEFDGNDSGNTVGPILPQVDGDEFTIFFVGQADDTAARVAFAAAGVALSWSVGATGLLQAWKFGVAFDEDGPATTTPINVVIHSRIGATSGTVMYVNGSIVSTSDANASIVGGAGELFVGSTSALTLFMIGRIAELMITEGRASVETIALWNAYSLDRYGV
jgi:hypothetical protein